MFKKDEWFEERQFTILHKIVLDLLPICRTLEQELSTSTSNIEISDSEGRTPLYWAAECGNVSAVATLLHYGALVSSGSIMGMTPLHYAIRAPNLRCNSLLLENGASVTVKNKWDQSPLNFASYSQNDASYITPLLDFGADINERDIDISMTHICTLFMNNLHTARCPISRGANITNPDESGLTSLNDSIGNNFHERISLFWRAEQAFRQ